MDPRLRGDDSSKMKRTPQPRRPRCPRKGGVREYREFIGSLRDHSDVCPAFGEDSCAQSFGIRPIKPPSGGGARFVTIRSP